MLPGLGCMPLNSHRIGSLPTLRYVPDFLTHLEEQYLLKEVHSSKAKWNVVSGRRVQVHGGTVHPKGLLKSPMPRWMHALADRVSAYTGIYGDLPANHVLVNCYLTGDGILPHQDGPLYHPAVCILSLGSPAVLRFWRKSELQGDQGDNSCSCPRAMQQSVASVVCEPRSLVIFQHNAYTECLHGIEFTAEDSIDDSCVNAEQCGLKPGDTLSRTGERTSLTVRRVLRTCGVSIRL